MKSKIYLLSIIALLLCSFIVSEGEIDITDETSQEQSEVVNQEVQSEESSISTAEVQETASNEETLKEETIEPEVKLPEMVVVQPIRRLGNSETKLNVGPCGGVEKGLADTLTNVGDKIYAIWEVRNPVAHGNCTVAMSPAMEENFTALKPTTKNVEFDEKTFSFPCGRQLGFEFQAFELPDNYACDHCTFQMTWTTQFGNIYSCSDMLILGNKSKLFY